ncbi:MAG: hypothetical protein AAFV53_38620 [Myxococcota bacterium]
MGVARKRADILASLTGVPRWLTIPEAIALLPRGKRKPTPNNPIAGLPLLIKAGIVQDLDGTLMVWSADMERIKDLAKTVGPAAAAAVMRAGPGDGLVAMTLDDIDPDLL